jgi:hypothetical protein
MFGIMDGILLGIGLALAPFVLGILFLVSVFVGVMLVELLEWVRDRISP